MIAFALLLNLAQSDTVEELSPATFDLVCSGHDKQTKAGHESVIMWKERFRIDLSTERYCRGTCGAVLPVAAVDENAITFNQVTIKSPEVTNIEMVNRHTGFYVQRMIAASSDLTSGFSDNVQGSCKVASFSGFPRQLF